MALAIGMLCSLQWPLAWQVLECPGTVNGEAITTGKEAGSGSSYSIVAIRPSVRFLKNKICQLFFGFSVPGELEGGGSILKINGIHSITLSPRPIIG
jgi:hypothetical protein